MGKKIEWLVLAVIGLSLLRLSPIALPAWTFQALSIIAVLCLVGIALELFSKSLHLLMIAVIVIAISVYCPDALGMFGIHLPNILDMIKGLIY